MLDWMGGILSGNGGEGRRGTALSYLTLLFAAFSIVGWVYETINQAIEQGGFHLRASLAGPWCPMYGIGGVILVLLLGWWAYCERTGWKRVGAVFVTAVGIYIITTVVELAAAGYCQVAMGYVPWDYSHSPLNFMGLTAPLYTIRFVIGGLIFIYVIAKPLARWVGENPGVAKGMSLAFWALMAFDCAMEFIGVWEAHLPRD